jgi:hypothetical protein
MIQEEHKFLEQNKILGESTKKANENYKPVFVVLFKIQRIFGGKHDM